MGGVRMSLIPGEQLAVLAFRAALVLAVIAVLWFGGSTIVDAVRAPVEAELNASRGNQAAAKSGIEAQNQGVRALVEDGKQRQARSAAAVEKAGRDGRVREERVRNAPPAGATDYERAVNRIDRELGLK